MTSDASHRPAAPSAAVLTSHSRIAGEVIEKVGKAFTDTGKVGKKFNPDHPEGTAGELQYKLLLHYHLLHLLHSVTPASALYRQRGSAPG